MRGIGFALVYLLTIIAAWAASPNIIVEQPAGSPIANGDSRALQMFVGAPSGALAFVVKNTGDADLQSFGIEFVGPPEVTVESLAPTLIQPGGSGTISVYFTSTTPGLKTGVLRIHSNDSEHSPFSITINASVAPPPQFAQQASLMAGNRASFHEFGSAIAISGNTAVVGAPFENSNATGVNSDVSDSLASHSGAAYVFVREGGRWTQQAYLKPSNTGAADQFGSAVAISGDTIVVGAYREDSSSVGVNEDGDDNSAGDSGAAYVFVRSGGVWTQQAYLKASNTGAGDQFGASVAISGDTILVGAPMEDSNATTVNGSQENEGATQSGAVYVFVRGISGWEQQAYLKSSNSLAGDQFGQSVAMQGDTVVVGAPRQDGGRLDSGAAYVFLRTASAWSQQAYLKAGDLGSSDFFGQSVAIDGDTLVVGKPEGDSVTFTTDAGAAYVFVREGTIWTQQARLAAIYQSAVDRFGWSVAISGNLLVIGCPYEDGDAVFVNGNANNNNANNAGAAFVYVRQAGAWNLRDYLKSSDAGTTTISINPNDEFGSAVAITGETVMVGAPAEDPLRLIPSGPFPDARVTDAGMAYAFVIPPNGPQLIVLQPANTRVMEGQTRHVGTVTTGSPPSISFVVTNLGNLDLTGLTVTIDGPQAATFAINNPPPSTLAPGAGAVFSVTCSPMKEAEASHLATLHIAGQGGDLVSLNVGLTATVGYSEIVVKQLPGIELADGDARDFGSVLVGRNTSLSFSVKAPGFRNLAVSEVLIDGPDAADFSVVTSPVTTNINFVGKPLVIGFAPTSTGPKTATLHIVNTDPDENPFDIQLSGIGVSPQNFAKQAYFKAGKVEPENAFGYSVALSGDTLAVAAPGEITNFGETEYSLGVVYIYVRNGNEWQQQAVVRPDRGNVPFASAVALDGDTLVVGEPYDANSARGINGTGEDSAAPDSGAVYVYVRNGTVWTRQAFLKADNADPGDLFGFSVSISGDTILVGAHGEASLATGVNGDGSGNSPFATGAAYVFVRNLGVWSQQAYLKAPAHHGNLSEFGVTVRISGNTAVVGDPREAYMAAGVDPKLRAGAAYVFVRDGASWSLESRLVAANADADDFFGRSVAVSGDTVAVGAPSEASDALGVNGASRNNAVAFAGAVYVFNRSGGAWTEQAYLKRDRDTLYNFGLELGLSTNTLAIGMWDVAESAGTLQDGAVSVFVREGSTWTKRAHLQPGRTNLFGQSLSVSGNSVAVGAFFDSSSATGINGNEQDASVPHSGAAYVFTVAPPALTVPAQNINAPTNGVMQFAFPNPDGSMFTVMGGDSLAPGASWTVLGTVTNIGGGFYQFADTNAASFPRRFYRLRFP